jgi:peptide-methionine (S)-S-oxide reductase
MRVKLRDLPTRPSNRAVLSLAALGVTCALLTAFARSGTAAKSLVPDPAVDKPLAAAAGTETMVVAGGCFWGVQAVFEHVKGVIRATSGYSGGSAKTASYEIVSTGRTGHAESVKVTYDPSRISYGQLLKVFFSVAHDPTQLNEQGPDVGTQYRSVIFFGDETQQRIAQAYVSQMGAAKVFRGRIVTDIVALKAFYEAEAHHQDYFNRHPFDPYIMINDKPKVEALRRQFPELYVERK